MSAWLADMDTGPKAARRTWVERWMPMEERYVERDDPVSCADVILDGTVGKGTATSVRRPRKDAARRLDREVS